MNKQIITYDEYTSYITKICRDITDSKWMPDYIVGITRGGCLPAVMISHYLNVPCHMLKVSLRDNDDNDIEHNCWMPEDIFNGHKILIVDDINDTGATINWIIDDWKSSCLPDSETWNNVWNENVRFAVITNNKASSCNVNMDYVGFEIDKSVNDVWISYPYEEWWEK